MNYPRITDLELRELMELAESVGDQAMAKACQLALERKGPRLPCARALTRNRRFVKYG